MSTEATTSTIPPATNTVEAPTTTADGKISFDQRIKGIPVAIWIKAIDANFVERNGWKPRELKVGTYGYDNYAQSLIEVIKAITSIEEDGNSPTQDDVVRAIFRGWKTSYTFWRDNRPWEKDAKYTAPFDPLGDERREAAASSTWDKLDEKEKEKDLALADIILTLYAEAQ